MGTGIIRNLISLSLSARNFERTCVIELGFLVSVEVITFQNSRNKASNPYQKQDGHNYCNGQQDRKGKH